MEEKKSNKKFTTLNIDGVKYKTTLTKKYIERKKYIPPNPKNIISFIPGTVIKVFVKEGGSVKAGAMLMLLESMKMENKILAPFDGIIKKINVENGQKIPKNHVLIEFE